MELQYVLDHTIFEAIVGSRAYGIHNEDSDYDKAGVMIPGKEYFLGLKKFEQFEGFPKEGRNGDHTVYDIRKAISLIADNNPNMLDLLYTPSHCIIETSSYWEEVQRNKDWFISKRCRWTYSGYAIAQLKRIKTHRNFLLNPPKEQPAREKYGLPKYTIFPTAQLKAVCSTALEFIPEENKPQLLNELDKIYADYVIPTVAFYLQENEKTLALEWLQQGMKSQAHAFIATGTAFLKEEYVEMAHKEIAYYNATKEWGQYQNWAKQRNLKRAELERKYGMDTKHAAHLVRLMRQGKEILETGNVNVDRTNIDAEELKAIRNGAWTYNQIEEYAQKTDQELTTLYEKSKLQKTPQLEKISDLCAELCESYFEKKR